MADPAVRISGSALRAAVRLKTWATGGETSLVPPGLNGQIRFLALGPGERLVLSDDIAGPQLCDRFRAHLTGYHIALVDLSCALKGLRVEGPAARDVLAKGCGLDLDPRSFPAGAATRTRFAQLPVVIECRDLASRYELYVGRSYVAYLKSWLEDAALEFQDGPT